MAGFLSLLDIRRWVFRAFVSLGFMPPRRLPEPKDLAWVLPGHSAESRRLQLKHLVTVIRTANAHNYYNRLLHALIPDWEVSFDTALFIGSGKGKYVWNAYRKVYSDDVWMIEKVYFARTDKIARVKWFHENLYGLYSNHFNVPKLLCCIESDILAATYSDFKILMPIPDNELLGNLIATSVQCYRLSDAAYGVLADEVPDFIADLEQFNAYQAYAETAFCKLRVQGLDVEYLQSLLDASPKIWAHGDLHDGNVFRNQIIIDWDFFGLYPIGLDVAQMYTQLLFRDQADMDLDYMCWLEREYKAYIKPEHWVAFKANFVLLSYIFAHVLFNRGRYRQLENDLFNDLRQIKPTHGEAPRIG